MVKTINDGIVLHNRMLRLSQEPVQEFSFHKLSRGVFFPSPLGAKEGRRRHCNFDGWKRERWIDERGKIAIEFVSPISDCVAGVTNFCGRRRKKRNY